MPMMRVKQQAHTMGKRGFTLVELLVYISIMTLALVSIVVLLTSATRIMNRVKEVKEVRSSALISLERMEREIKNATSVVVGESDLGTTAGSLTLQSADELGNPLEVSFDLEGGDLLLYYDDVSRGSLFSENVSATELEFYRVDNTLSESVKIKLTLSHDDAPTKEETYYLTAVLRGSY